MADRKFNPTSVLGGTMGWLDEIGELAIRGQGALVEAREPIKTPMPEYIRREFPSSGSIEFHKPDPKKIIEAALVQNQKRKTELTIEDLARYGLAGASNQQLAREGNYQENYEGESLRSIYNLVFVFFKRLGEAIKEKMKSSINPFTALGKRTSSKAAVSGANDLLFNASAQEGQSMTSSASAVRGAA